MNKRHFTALLLCMSLIGCFCAAAAAAAFNKDIMDGIRKAVHKELADTVSSSVEIGDLRIIKGEECLGGSEVYSVAGVTMNGYSGRNKMTLSLNLVDRKSAVKNITVEAAYDVPVDVYVTSRSLAGGSVLGEGDYYTVKQKSSRLPVGAVTDKKDLDGRTLKTTMSQGIIIKSEYLAARAGVKKGHRVTVIVEVDNVMISATGLLRRDAVVGGSARVFCDSSKKELTGVLVDPETVRIKI